MTFQRRHSDKKLEKSRLSWVREEEEESLGELVKLDLNELTPKIVGASPVVVVAAAAACLLRLLQY